MEVQEYLDDYSHDLHIANLPSAAEGRLLSKLLVALPVEPRHYTGQSSTTFDANSYYEGRFALLLRYQTKPSRQIYHLWTNFGRWKATRVVCVVCFA